VEGEGFEPSVPRSRERTSGARSDLQEEASIAVSWRPLGGVRFAHDSPVEGGVSCELVSEIEFASLAK
jgi:hypothetical protein